MFIPVVVLAIGYESKPSLSKSCGFCEFGFSREGLELGRDPISSIEVQPS